MDPDWDGALLTKDGAGTLILSADNTYTGGTIVNAGTLQIGNGGTPRVTSRAQITNDGVLAFDRSEDAAELAFDDVISGTGSVVQRGAGVVDAHRSQQLLGRHDDHGGHARGGRPTATWAPLPET